VSDDHNFAHLETVYALAIQNGDYRRGSWLAVRGLRTRPSEAEKVLWRLRLQGCLRRRHV
jgi:hypothetical protein